MFVWVVLAFKSMIWEVCIFFASGKEPRADVGVGFLFWGVV